MLPSNSGLRHCEKGTHTHVSLVPQQPHDLSDNTNLGNTPACPSKLVVAIVAASANSKEALTPEAQDGTMRDDSVQNCSNIALAVPLPAESSVDLS